MRIARVVGLHFLAQTNRADRVVFLAAFGTAPWNTITNAGPFTAATKIVVMDSLADQARFNRLRTP